MAYEVTRGDYLVSADRVRLNVDAIHAFLTGSYWAEGISHEQVAAAIEHSLAFGLYHHDTQVGFARAITDYVTFAYLADVYVEEAHRGQGLSKLLLEAVLAHPQLQPIRRWMRGTRDAHGLYAQVGFIPLDEPQRWMELPDPEAYTTRAKAEA